MNLLENKQIHKGDNRSINAFHSDNRKYIFIYSIELYGIFDSLLRLCHVRRGLRNFYALYIFYASYEIIFYIMYNLENYLRIQILQIKRHS